MNEGLKYLLQDKLDNCEREMVINLQIEYVDG